MISIIISSANKNYLDAVKESIAKTIGCAYELLAYENTKGERGICEIYNQGADEAKYDVLCFMHEDIEYKTQGWGKIVLRIFSENPSLGLLGLAGGDYKSLAPSSWFNFEAPTEFPGNKYINVLQGFKSSRKEPFHDFSNPKNQKTSRVACIDGLWMCTKKSIVTKIKFDEKILKGFHGYDIDYSIAVGQDYMVGVTFEIVLHHFSEGGSTKEWVEAQAKIHKKWSSILPINLTGSPLRDCVPYEKYYFRNFLTYAKNMGISKASLIDIIQSARASSAMSVFLYLKLRWYVHKIFINPE